MAEARRVAYGILVPYSPRLATFFPDHDPSRVTWVPHAAGPDFLLRVNDAPRRLVFVSGNMHANYPLRRAARDLALRRPELARIQWHPGYGWNFDSGLPSCRRRLRRDGPKLSCRVHRRGVVPLSRRESFRDSRDRRASSPTAPSLRSSQSSGSRTLCTISPPTRAISKRPSSEPSIPPVSPGSTPSGAAVTPSSTAATPSPTGPSRSTPPASDRKPLPGVHELTSESVFLFIALKE